MTRRSRRDIEKRIAELEEAVSDGVESMSTEQLYIASLEISMPGGPAVPEDVAERIGAEYRARIQGGGGSNE